MTKAEAEARLQAQELTKAAEAQAQGHAEEIVKAAEVRAQQQAQELLSQSRKMLERTIVEKFRDFVEDLLSDAKEIETKHP
jgi:vacuolar-type H+-ATPase subunit H